MQCHNLQRRLDISLTASCLWRYGAGPEGQAVRLICVPSFARTGAIVMLNLRTLECHSIVCDHAIGQEPHDATGM